MDEQGRLQNPVRPATDSPEAFSVRDAAKSFADIFVSGIATRKLNLEADLRSLSVAR